MINILIENVNLNDLEILLEDSTKKKNNYIKIKLKINYFTYVKI